MTRIEATVSIVFSGERARRWLMLYSRPSHLIYIFCNFFFISQRIFNDEKVMVFDRMDDFFSLLYPQPLQLEIKQSREGVGGLSDASSIRCDPGPQLCTFFRNGTGNS